MLRAWRTCEAVRKQQTSLLKYGAHFSTAIVHTMKQVNLDFLVASHHRAIVATIQQASDALSIEKVVKLFSTASEQICGLQEVGKLVLERFRIIFQAAKDYGPLLAHYEKWERIEGQIEELVAAVAELQATKGAKKAS